MMHEDRKPGLGSSVHKITSRPNHREVPFLTGHLILLSETRGGHNGNHHASPRPFLINRFPLPLNRRARIPP